MAGITQPKITNVNFAVVPPFCHTDMHHYEQRRVKCESSIDCVYCIPTCCSQTIDINGYAINKACGGDMIFAVDKS